MKILDLRVNWMNWCGNTPCWAILVDQVPCSSSLTYQFRKGHVFAETPEGYVVFGWVGPEINARGEEIPAEHRGYGGAKFTFRLDDGSELVTTNLWSSRPARLNQLGFTPSVDVTICDRPQDWAQGRYGSYSGHITLAALETALEQFPQVIGGLTVEPVPYGDSGESFLCYLPGFRGMNWREAKAWAAEHGFAGKAVIRWPRA